MQESFDFEISCIVSRRKGNPRMQHPFRALAIAALTLLALPAPAQQLPPYRAPRFPGTQAPDLNGIWQAMNSANWDLEPHAAGPSPFPALLGTIGAEPAGLGVV